MKAATKTVSWAAACCTLVGVFEGCDLVAKTDKIGTGQPLTWCHGETIGDARPGQRFTKKQCDDMLAARLPEYWEQIAPCIKVETSDNEKIAYTSASYNFGAGAFCWSGKGANRRPSPIVARLNAGDHAGACDALMLYTHARGVEVRGLVNRRRAERKICLTPDDAPGVATTRTSAIPTAKPTIRPDVVQAKAPPKPALFSRAWWAAVWAWWIAE
ncbi:hypothetical protein AOQ73_05935 [Bradyrhizobium pachyrhizi]|uniref:lysozyme n=1 Tax=Bradyrhizobium pachyrhizi TaxID=280333 RepID=UPI0007055EF3|nr:lysozyme [Bradyrhizobium pachyrhizi]KRQ11946.1 hypothetical protein AOQ73_05935 [Bradyrhizobium pachyrhizi]